MAGTYKDIQRLTGLSLSTISKYFNDGALRDENRAAIERATRELGYQSNDIARGLKSKKTRTVGVLIPELNSTFLTTIMSEVCRVLRENGYGAIVCDCRLDKGIEREALTFLLNKLVDGIITVPLDKTGGVLSLARERGVPVVLVDRLVTHFKADAVLLDNESAAALAANAFLENGHTAIAMIGGRRSVYTMLGRGKGFTDRLLAEGVEPNPDWIISTDFTVDGGYRAAKRLLCVGARPTALFTANYELTLGAVIALNELGLQIPEELSLIGFDNLELAQIVKPRLTMIMQPMNDIAQSAARLMLERLASPGAPGYHTVEMLAELVPGGSVRNMRL